MEGPRNFWYIDNKQETYDENKAQKALFKKTEGNEQR